jgi:hypothetical protein
MVSPRVHYLAPEAAMIAMATALAATLASSPAVAGRMPLDAQNRIHAGLSITDNPSGVGGTLGMDSRLTRLIYVDLGGFYTGGVPDFNPDARGESQGPTDWYTLKHGVYAAPGMRIPHRYQDGFNWDLIGRMGFAALWIADESQAITPSTEAIVYSEPALLTGIDVLLRYEQLGVRLSGKAFGWRTFSPVANSESGFIRGQFCIEGVYQF